MRAIPQVRSLNLTLVLVLTLISGLEKTSIETAILDHSVGINIITVSPAKSKAKRARYAQRRTLALCVKIGLRLSGSNTTMWFHVKDKGNPGKEFVLDPLRRARADPSLPPLPLNLLQVKDLHLLKMQAFTCPLLSPNFLFLLATPCRDGQALPGELRHGGLDRSHLWAVGVQIPWETRGIVAPTQCPTGGKVRLLTPL